MQCSPGRSRRRLLPLSLLVASAMVWMGCGDDGGDITTPAEVASVEVTPDTTVLRLTANPTVQLQATPKDADGNTLADRQVGWSSSNTALATVSAAGMVTAVDSGTATVTATSEGHSGSAYVIVAPDDATALCNDGSFSRSQTQSGTCSNHQGMRKWLDQPPPQPPQPTSGVLVVTTATSGESPDSDGYGVVVDGAGGQAIGANDSLTLAQLSAGSHAVGLEGIAGNCQVSGDNPVSVAITAGDTARVAFGITCTAPPPTVGTLKVTTITTGVELDPDGYQFTVGGRASQPIAVNASVNVTNVAAGVHTVQISGLASNCTLQGTNPRTVTVPANGSTELRFRIECAATTGTIHITTTTTGSPIDPDGYVVGIDSGAGKTIGVNDTLDVAGVPAGPHTVQFSGVADNCGLDGPSSRSVTVPAGGAVPVEFRITCSAPPSGVASVDVAPDSTLLRLTARPTVQLAATPKDSAGQPLPGRTVTWASSDASRAAVSSAGLVSAAQPGVVTITATSEGRSGTAAVIIAPDDATALCQDTTFSTSQNRSGTCSSHGGVRIWLSVLVITRQPPAQVTSGAAFDPQPVVQLQSPEGHDFAAAGVAVTITVESGQRTLSGTTTRSTDAQGRAVFNDLALSGDAGTDTLVFSAPGYTSVHAPIVIVEAPPDSAKSSIAADPDTVQAGQTSQITVTVRDASGTTLVGREVTLNGGTDASLTPATVPSDANGNAVFTFTSTEPETKTIAAAADGVALGQTTVTVQPVPTTATLTVDAPVAPSPGAR